RTLEDDVENRAEVIGRPRQCSQNLGNSRELGARVVARSERTPRTSLTGRLDRPPALAPFPHARPPRTMLVRSLGLSASNSVQTPCSSSGHSVSCFSRKQSPVTR